jgi:polygalacturonase
VVLETGDKGENAFLTGALTLEDGAVLVVNKGVTLYGSRDPKDYDPDPTDKTTPLLCGTLSEVSAAYVTAKEAAAGKPAELPPLAAGRRCRSLLNVTGKNVGVMGMGTIDGRGGAQVVGHDYTWWQMARRAEPKQLRYYSTMLLTADHADGLVLYQITLHNSPNYHVSVRNTDGFTAWGVHLLTPTVRGTDDRNTDGIDPSSSTNITIAHSWIDNGDDNIAIKSHVQHMSVLDNHFYDGHGMSLGSEVAGDAHILVDGLVEDHTTSGIRVKSNAVRGGPVEDITFRNICMRNTTIPIAISPYYNNGTIESFTDPNVLGPHIPEYKKIVLDRVTSTTPGDVLIAGKDADHMTQVTLTAVQVHGITPEQVHAQYDDVTLGPGPVNFTPAGAGVTVAKVTDRGHLVPIHNCPATVFVPMR